MLLILPDLDTFESQKIYLIWREIWHFTFDTEILDTFLESENSCSALINDQKSCPASVTLII